LRIYAQHIFLGLNTSKSAKRADGGERVAIELNVNTSDLTVLDDLSTILRVTGRNAIGKIGGSLDRSSGPVRVRFSSPDIPVRFYINLGEMIDANTPKTK
jgi:hypothetical protein